MNFNTFFEETNIVQDSEIVFEESIIEEASDADKIKNSDIKVKAKIPLPGKNGTVYEFFTNKDALSAAKLLGMSKDDVQGNTITVK